MKQIDLEALDQVALEAAKVGCRAVLLDACALLSSLRFKSDPIALDLKESLAPLVKELGRRTKLYQKSNPGKGA